MEEYLQHIMTLRSQMNDVEDQAAMISVEEQTHITIVETLEKDLSSVRAEMKQLKEDSEQMIKAKGEICSQILQKQRKICSLDSDLSTLAQALELIQQERVNLSAQLVEKSAYYKKVSDDIKSKFQQQQDWVNTHRNSDEMGDHGLMREKLEEPTVKTEGKHAIDNHLIMDNLVNDVANNLKDKLDFAKAKLDEIAQMKSKLVIESYKMKQSMEQLKSHAKDFKTELLGMDIKTLEEEHNALLSDEAGELEYLQSLQKQIKQFKDISHVVKCACGVEYKVAMDFCA